jgi:hypothetical protein
MAYLPRCDLGVLLLDAGSTLNQEDLRILGGLHEAAIPALVLLSKCDLLMPADRLQMVQYITRQVDEKLGLSITVVPVSTVGEDAVLAHQWFGQYVQPLLDKHRDMLDQSIRRKIGGLRQMLAATLASILRREQGRSPQVAETNRIAAQKLLEEASTTILRVTDRTVGSLDGEPGESVAKVIARAAEELIPSTDNVGKNRRRLVDIVLDTMASDAAEVREELVNLDVTLNRVAVELGGMLTSVSLRAIDTNQVEVTLTSLPPFDDRTIESIRGASPPRIVAWLPGLARPILRAWLRRRCDFALETAIRDHRRELRKWAKRNLQRALEGHEIRCGPYREYLRWLGGEAVTAQAPDLSDLERDIEWLRSLVPATIQPREPAPRETCGQTTSSTAA